jgi:chemotaxis methyl-accepting protein methylase
MNNLLQQTESTIEALESIRESIIQIEATDANREILDEAYAGVVSAIAGLSKLVGMEVRS